MRSITDICKDADANRNDRVKLYELYGYVKENEYYYSPSEIQFMMEHITGYIDNLDKRIISI
jgi:hypothetical protein